MKKAVLVGYNWNSLLGLARALGSDGYEVGVIRTGAVPRNPLKRIGLAPEKKSCFIREYYNADASNDEEIIQLLLHRIADPEHKYVLIPVDDRAAEIIDKNLNRLKDYFFTQNVDYLQGGVVRLMDKSYQKQLAQAAGLNVTNGHSISVKSGKYTIPDTISYPCFAKAEEPFPGRKNFMGRCCNREELEELLNRVAITRDCNMIVEDYLKIEKEYCIVGFCARGKVLIPDVIDEMVLGHGEHAGVTCFGRVLPPSRFDMTMIERLKEFLRTTDFSGLFTIDIFQSKDEFYFGELNLRIGGSGIAVIGAGVNIAVIAAEILQGHECDQLDQECREITFVSERPLINDLVTQQISRKVYKQLISKADFQFIYSEVDKAPQKSFRLYVVRQYLRSIVHKLKSKN